MISSTRSSCTACMAAVYGSGCAIWPCASIPAPRSAASARLSRRSASGCSASLESLCGADDQEATRASAAARALISLEQRPRRAPSRSRSRARSPRRPRAQVDDDVLDRDASPPPCGSGSITSRRIQPERCSGWVETTISVDRRLELRERVAHRIDRVGVDDEAVGRDPRLTQVVERLVEPAPGRGAPRVLVDDVPSRGGFTGQTTVTWTGPASARRASALVRPRPRPSRSRRRGRGHVSVRPSRARGLDAGRPVEHRVPRARDAVLVRAPTTCGSSSKLKYGGGEETCHSSVSERHGFASAFGPRTQL